MCRVWVWRFFFLNLQFSGIVKKNKQQISPLVPTCLYEENLFGNVHSISVFVRLGNEKNIRGEKRASADRSICFMINIFFFVIIYVAELCFVYLSIMYIRMVVWVFNVYIHIVDLMPTCSTKFNVYYIYILFSNIQIRLLNSVMKIGLKI